MTNATSTYRNKGRWKDAISYQRVSTERQGAHGIGLDGQRAAIDTYAELERLRVVERFQDVASGRGDKNLAGRPGLQAAIRSAKATGRPILVSGLDRISRETTTIDEIVSEHGITVISAGDGRMRNPIIIASQAARAQREGELISQRTREALQRKKAEGALLGNRKNLPEARKRAVEKKKQLADKRVAEIVAILDELSGQDVTAKQLVEILNQRGLLTSRRLPWTVPAIRRPLKRAREFIKRREQERAARTYGTNPLFGRF